MIRSVDKLEQETHRNAGTATTVQKKHTSTRSTPEKRSKREAIRGGQCRKLLWLPFQLDGLRAGRPRAEQSITASGGNRAHENDDNHEDVAPQNNHEQATERRTDTRR